MFPPAVSGNKHSAACVGYVLGNQSVPLTLYADSGNNQPGAMLAQGTGTTNTEFGSCCGVTKARIHMTTLAAHTPYRVAITMTGSNFEAAAFQVSSEVDNDVYVATTSDGENTWSTGVSQTEYNPPIGVE